VTEAPAAAQRHELEDVARTMRGSLGSLRAAAETLERYPGMDAPRRARLLAAVSEESRRLSELVERLEKLAARARPPAPATAELTLGELLAALERSGRQLGMTIETAQATSPEVPPATVFALPADTLSAAFVAFLGALRRDLAVAACRLAARPAGRLVLLDLDWTPDPGELPPLLDWQSWALDAGAPDARPPVPGLRSLAREHEGEVWFNLDRDGGRAHVRVLLPLAAEPAATGH
jgi:DNA polymerase-3 subunit epsilon